MTHEDREGLTVSQKAAGKRLINAFWPDQSIEKVVATDHNRMLVVTILRQSINWMIMQQYAIKVFPEEMLIRIMFGKLNNSPPQNRNI